VAINPISKSQASRLEGRFILFMGKKTKRMTNYCLNKYPRIPDLEGKIPSLKVSQYFFNHGILILTSMLTTLKGDQEG
jgi:hypothetical protein